MCGIIALYPRSLPLAPVDGALTAMLAALDRRGPDTRGRHVSVAGALAAARLAIRDPAGVADQPFASHDGRLRIVFNGEIYNDRELRRQLGPPPGGWRTRSDVETVLAGYEAFGPQIAAKLEGQFAFAVLDERRRTLTIGRDPFGVCPLYVAEVGGLVVVASSLRAILAGFPGRFTRADPLGVTETLLLRFTIAPNTVVSGIRQLPPGELAVFDGSRTKGLRHFRLQQVNLPESEELTDTLARLLDVAVAGACVSDAPVGLFLSGGLDSGIVAALAAPHLSTGAPAATLSFPGADAEAEAAGAIATRFGFRHVVVDAHKLDLGELMADTLDCMDTPIGARDAPAVAAMARALKTEEPSVKVVLTGTGSDEQFGGYRKAYFGPISGPLHLQIAHFVSTYSTVEPAWRDELAATAGVDVIADITRRLEVNLLDFAPDLDPSAPGRVLDLLYMTTHLPGWELATADMMTMHWSLEARVPFLNRRLVAFALSLDDNAKTAAGLDKAALRQAAARWLGPASLRPKIPLSRPVAGWLSQTAMRGAWRPGPLADLGFDSQKLGRMGAADAPFDLRFRVETLDRWIGRHLSN